MGGENKGKGVSCKVGGDEMVRMFDCEGLGG